MSRWLLCSACRKDIPFGARHWVCSVSTCNRARTRLVFCSVPCWDSHVVVLRHRDAWAVEAVAPTHSEAPQPVSPAPPAQKVVTPPPRQPPAPQVVARPPLPPPTAPQVRAAPPARDDDEVLVVVSKIKKYIRDRSGMNTSDAVADVLSDHVRALCDLAIRAAAAEGRKTVLDRDLPRGSLR